MTKEILKTIDEFPMPPSICPVVLVFTNFKANFNEKEFRVKRSEKTDQKAFIYLLTGLKVNANKELIVANNNDIFQFFKSNQDIMNPTINTISVV